MKFHRKIFLVIISITAIAFCISGVVIISEVFNYSLNQEIERGKEESLMLQFAFQASIDSVSEEYLQRQIYGIQERNKDVNEFTQEGYEEQGYILYNIVNSIKRNRVNKKSYMRLLDENRNIIFSDIDKELDKELFDQVSKESRAYKIFHRENNEEKKYYLDVISVIKVEDRNFYLENISDISYVYEERERLFSSYRILIIFLLLSIGGITLIISYWLTKSIKDLSTTTEKFAQGDYTARANIKTNDEIGMLSNNFNIMAEALEEKIQKLSNEARKLEDFMASFSHELKTPLTSIIGYSDMLRSMELSKEDIFQSSNYIYSQGKRLESLSLKLLELMVIKNQEFKFEDFQVRKIIEESLTILNGPLKEKHINLKMKLDEGRVQGDKDLLISLFTNIIDNARKACEEKGNIEICGENQKSVYKIIITDNGCGIPEEDLDKIKEAFYMVDKSRARKDGGAGMGITICEEILKLHNAMWSIESKLDIGTKITLIFRKKGC